MFIQTKSWLLLGVFIVMLVKGGRDARKEAGGYISFGEAFKHI